MAGDNQGSGNIGGLDNACQDANQNFGPSPLGSANLACGSTPPMPLDPKKKHWVAIEMLDVEGKPVAGMDYQITLPDGSTLEGILDTKGTAMITGIDAGNCQVSFPGLDRDSWEPK